MPVHSLMLSSHLFFCPPHFLPPWTVPCRNVLARPVDRVMCPYHFSFRSCCLSDSFCHFIVCDAVFVRDAEKSLNATNKCNYFWAFKTCFEKELYVSSLPDLYVITLMKFWCFNHKLRIELGRLEGIERNDRICIDCNMNARARVCVCVCVCLHVHVCACARMCMCEWVCV